MKALLLCTAAALALGACAYRDGGQQISRYFGRANASNIAAHAEAARHDQSMTDGQVVGTAVDKYKNGDPPPAVTATASRIDSSSSHQGN